MLLHDAVIELSSPNHYLLAAATTLFCWPTHRYLRAAAMCHSGRYTGQEESITFVVSYLFKINSSSVRRTAADNRLAYTVGEAQVSHASMRASSAHLLACQTQTMSAQVSVVLSDEFGRITGAANRGEVASAASWSQPRHHRPDSAPELHFQSTSGSPNAG